MPGNVFGQLFRISTFGESHGGAIGVVLDGVPPGLAISEAEVQKDLDRRKPGQSEVTTSRAETDTVHFLSGVFEGRATGTPLMMIIYNKDANPSAYDEIKDLYRPGHADFTYQHKYGLRDHRGSGRASGRETAARVAAGAVAKKILAHHGVRVVAYTVQAAGIACKTRDLDEIENNIVRACDPQAAKAIVARIMQAKDDQDSIGGIVECTVSGMPIGLGEPVFDRLDADLAKAILSIGATKGIEFGAGFAAAEMTGRQHNDEMDAEGFLTNNAGGILGGISTGEELVFRTVFKPTSSIAQPQKTQNVQGQAVVCRTEGRHDPSIFPRAVPVVEAMTAITLVDHLKRHLALNAGIDIDPRT